jgi:hypothetical protein
MAERTDSTARAGNKEQGLERAKTILAEFTDAARSAAMALADEQKEFAAKQVNGVAEAVRSAARSLDHSQSPTVARYADQAAGQIEELAHGLRRRQWGDIIADIEDIARRQPALFVAGAIAAGFLAGRFLSVSAGRNHKAGHQPEAAARDAVEAAVSSASGTGDITGTSKISDAREAS